MADLLQTGPSPLRLLPAATKNPGPGKYKIDPSKNQQKQVESLCLALDDCWFFYAGKTILTTKPSHHAPAYQLAHPVYIYLLVFPK
ncbi:MAG: hypothetical protein H6577_28135 [Lewinellaceae bacterium]|nr:hypothetical protein [Saprospiraceae bacterium]MCB9342016.1 hypothetical protein [Lewinellaceae bacterium]